MQSGESQVAIGFDGTGKAMRRVSITVKVTGGRLAFRWPAVASLGARFSYAPGVEGAGRRQSYHLCDRPCGFVICTEEIDAGQAYNLDKYQALENLCPPPSSIDTMFRMVSIFRCTFAAKPL
jgi:hypothetical protein